MRALGDVGNIIKFELDSESPPLEFDFDTPMFRMICATLRRHDPAGTPLPHMITGATDAKHVARLGAICYGFSPMKFQPGESFFDLVHGHDERISIAAWTGACACCLMWWLDFPCNMNGL